MTKTDPEWDEIASTVFTGLREGRSVAAVVRAHPRWPKYSTVLSRLMSDYYDEYERAKRDGAEAVGDMVQDMLNTLMTGKGDARTAKVFLEGAMRRMGQMNTAYNDRRVHHEHTHKVDNTLRQRLEEAEARVKALEQQPLELDAEDVTEAGD